MTRSVRLFTSFMLTMMMSLTVASATLLCNKPAVTRQQIANALAASPNLKSSLQTCAMAAMGMQESGGGHTCAYNGSCCYGILQLNIPNGTTVWDPVSHQRITGPQYATRSLQDQVNIWATTANSNASSRGFNILQAAYNTNTPIHGVPITAGILTGCEQFGAVVCDRNVTALQNSGNCGTYTDGKGHNNGQTICSWGNTPTMRNADKNCSLSGTCKGNQTNNPVIPANLASAAPSVGNMSPAATTPTPANTSMALITPTPTTNWTYTTSPNFLATVQYA